MKIALYNTTPTQDTFDGSSDWRVRWSEGTVEKRSSGGPLFNNLHQIIGQVHGGNPADVCTANANALFGRFDLSWAGGNTNATRLSNWLDPAGTNAMAINSRVFTTVAGPTLVCTTGSFTLQNQTPGSTVTWSSSDAAILSLNPTTGLATKQTNWGQVTITASLLSPGACAPATFTRTTHAGPPSASISTLIFPSGQRGVNPVSLSANRTYNFNVDFVHGATTYTWSLPSGFSFVNGSTTSIPAIKTSSTNGTYTLNCRANNSCGSNWTHDLTINIGGGGQQQLAVYPNPTSSSLTIESSTSSLTISDPGSNQEVNSLQTESTPYSFSAKLLNQLNLTLLDGESKEGKVVFDVSALQDGVYYLHIARGGEIKKLQIIIKK